MRLSVRGVYPPHTVVPADKESIGRVVPSGHIGVPLTPYRCADKVATVSRGSAVERGVWYRPKKREECFLSTVDGSYEGLTTMMVGEREIPCAVIDSADMQEERLSACTPRTDPTLEQLLEMIEDAAIVDELTGRPLLERIALWREIKPKYLVVDVTDLGPFLSAGAAVVRDYGRECLAAVTTLCALIGMAKGVLAVPSSLYHDLRKKLGRAVVRGDERYPHETVLPDRRIVTVGPQAMLALWNVMASGEAQTEIAVTVAGDAVETPQHLWVPVGCLLSDLLKRCGVTEDCGAIFLGDILGGIEVTDFSLPLWQDVTCLLAMKRSSAPQPSVCNHCGWCLSACHRGLNPCLILQAYENEWYDRLGDYGAERCDQCGACSFICPAGQEVSRAVGRAACLGNAVEITVGGDPDRG